MTVPYSHKPHTEAPPRDIDELAERFHVLERFIVRRFDEVSAEIHATSEIMGMAEDGIEKRFGEILGVLGAITHQGTGSTAPNIGVELGAVVKTTEDAAFQIIQSAEKIGDAALDQTIDWASPDVRGKALGEIKLWADDILVACAFQDLTGQRIAKTLENIRRAEEELSETLQKMGLRIDVEKTKSLMVETGNTVQGQNAIDELFK
jgi:hypothetical protein